MGLDMYFYKDIYIGNTFRAENPELFGEVIPIKVEGVKTERVSYIREQVGYLRKVNSIHNWIIKNCADGEDNCQDIYLTTENMKMLLADINEVLDNPKEAKNILPNSEGCFFGSQKYDKYYFEDLKEAKKILKGMLNEQDEGDFYYRASW